MDEPKTFTMTVSVCFDKKKAKKILEIAFIGN